MKIESTFVIEIDGATFVFKKPTMRELLQAQGTNFADFVFGKLVQVTGLSNGDGHEVDTEQLKTLDLPADAVFAIVNKWNEKISLMLNPNKEAEAKKESQPTLNG